MKLTLSFPIGIVGDIGHSELYRELYKGITEIVRENDVDGIQIYPAQWPRKVLVTVNNNDAKEALVIAGVTFGNQHIELKDEAEEMTRITIKDALISWPDQKIREMLEPYGKIVGKIDKEMLYVNGKKTSWTTGTRYVYMCPVQEIIPQRLTTIEEGKQVAISVWYKRPLTESQQLKCRRCGANHEDSSCTYDQKVCFLCHGSHERRDCPMNDGSRVSDEVFCFMGEKSPLSNFNTNYPTRIDDVIYLCNEQYIQSQKAKCFGDKERERLIMKESDPRVMKRLGREVKGYIDAEWKEKTDDIIMTCVRQKVYQHLDLQGYLLKTGNRRIAEGTSDRHFGVGFHISDARVMNHIEWTGRNLMGRALMDIRSEIKMIEEITSEKSSDMPFDADEEFFDAGTQIPVEVPIKQQAMPEKAKEKRYAVLIGDSNIEEVRVDISSTNLSLEKICRPGAKLQDIDEMLRQSDIEPDAVQIAMVHLGNSNWSSDLFMPVDSGENVYREYVETINTISVKFRQAELLLSSILPRDLDVAADEVRKHREAINTEVNILNKKLNELANTEQNVTFIDNDDAFKMGENPNPEMYVKNDNTGVNLSHKGVMILTDKLTECVQKKYPEMLQHGTWCKK